MPDQPDDPTLPGSVPTDQPTAAFLSPDGSETLNGPPCGPDDVTERIAPGRFPEIPGYEIERELGRGGMGVVYRARQHSLNRLVALKMVLAGSYAKADDLVRFLAEAETAAKLRHQGIVQIYESGRHGGLPYFTMEYVEGGTLAERLSAGPLTPAEAARIALALAEAVAAAHAAGVVHRDLKPANILLNGDTPKITDFGLARRLEAGDGLTKTGSILGTPSYMPPEQAKGDVRHVGPAGDTYSLGAILYEMLTGRPPFRSDSPVQTLSRVLNSVPATVRSVNPTVPRDLETIALKCLEKSPERRYASADALANDLRRFLDGRTITARRVGSIERLRRWARRNPAVASLLAAVIVSLTVGTVVSASLAVRSAANAERADGNARELGHKVIELDVARGDAEKKAGEADVARRALARTLADSYTTLGEAASDRNELSVAGLWFARAVRQSEGDPDREFFNRVRVRNWETDSFAPVRAFRSDSPIEQLAFHPGGRYLVGSSRAGRSHVWDLDREAIWPTPEGFGDLAAATWDPVGRLLALATSGKKAGVFKFPSGEPVRIWEWTEPVTAVGFSSDGRKVAFGGSTVRVWDLTLERFTTPELKHPGTVYALNFDPRGERLVTAATNGSAYTYDLTAAASATPFRVIPHSARFSPPIAPQFADGGKLLITTPTYVTIIATDVATGRQQFQYSDPKSFCSLAVSPDGKTVWVGGGQRGAGAYQIDVDEGTRRPAHLPHTNAVTAMAFTADATGIVTASRDRTACIWDTATARLRYVPLIHSGIVLAVACTPDGRFLATVCPGGGSRADSGGLIRVWAVPSGPPTRVIDTGANLSLARFVSGGRYVLPVGGTYHEATLDRVQLTPTAAGAAAPPAVEPGGLVLDADVTTDGRWLVTLSIPQKARGNLHAPVPEAIRFWDVATGKPVGEAIDAPSEPRSVRFRPDGREAAVLCHGGQILILDPVAARVKRTFTTRLRGISHAHYVNNGMIRYVADGRILVYGMSPALWAGDPETGSASLIDLSTSISYDVSPSADEQVWAISEVGATGVRLLSPATGKPVASAIEHPDWVFSARFDRTGDRVLTACRDGVGRLWDRRAGRILATYRHADEVFGAEFMPGERFVVTVSADGTARVWDAGAGQPVCRPIPLGGNGLTLDLTPDGRHAVAAGFTSRVTILDLARLTNPVGGNAEELTLWAELSSGQRITDSGGVAFLTADEWLDRWREYRRRHPLSTAKP